MENKNGNTNFWISYADLMAGLLFVFILLIGAIIVKYTLLQSESEKLEKNLEQEHLALMQRDERIKSIVDDLEKTRKNLKNKLLENEKLQITLDEKSSLINKQKDDLEVKEKSINTFLLSNKELKEKIKNLDDKKKELLENINNLDETLKNKDEKITLFTKENSDYKNRLNQVNQEKEHLELNLEKLDSLSKEKEAKLNKLLEDLLLKEQMISSFEEKNSDLNKKLQENEQAILLSKEENLALNKQSDEYKKRLEELTKNSEEKESELNKLIEDLLVKKSLIESFKEKNRVLDDEMKVMKQKLLNSQEKEKVLTSELSNTKEKIKSFTGIKVKVISQLKTKLGNSIEIDPRNGSLRLSSNVLFDEGKSTLKRNAKKALKVAVYDYFQTILDNEEINKHIDKIVIEGHTNSKGNYLYNLQLSQKRAYSVMDFLLTLDFNKQENLKELIAASGRSFLDPIYDENGKEDPNASRRIEIKLSLKNEQAIKEIANLLE